MPKIAICAWGRSHDLKQRAWLNSAQKSGQNHTQINPFGIVLKNYCFRYAHGPWMWLCFRISEQPESYLAAWSQQCHKPKNAKFF